MAVFKRTGDIIRFGALHGELRLLNAAAFGHSGRNPVVASGFTTWQTLCDARARQVGFACLRATC